MIDVVPESKFGTVLVRHHTVTELEAQLQCMKGLRSAPETVAVLEVDGQIMMSDSLHEHITNTDIVLKSHGVMLIVGLGLGMILHPILAKPGVRSVTVVERNPDVIALIAPTLTEHLETGRLEIVEGNIFAWEPPIGVRYDVVYFDIWPTIAAGNYEQTKTLHRRALRWRKKGGVIMSWCRDRFRDMHRDGY